MRGQPQLYTDFGGGLHSRAAPYVLEDNECREALNVQSTVTRAITKRNGLLTFASPPVTLDSLYAIEATASPVLIAHGATSLYKVTAAGTVTAIRTGLTNGARWEWVQAPASGGQGPVWGMNGVDAPQQWDGVSASTSAWTAGSGSLPNGRYLLFHSNYVFVAGVAANPSRLYWCQITPGTGTDPRAWPAANVVDLDPADGDAITGLGKVGSLLLVTKRHKTFVIYDPATGANRRVSDSIGCVSHRSIAETPAGTFFLGEGGVWRTDGSRVDQAPVSDRVGPQIASITLPAQAAAVYWDNHYYLSYSTDSISNGVTLDYDLTLGSWWLHSIGSNQWSPWHPSPALAANLYSAKATGAVIDRCFVAGVWQDNGTNVPWYWKGPWLSPSFYRRRRSPTPFYRKRLRAIRADGAGTVDASLATNFAGAETLVASNIFTSDPALTFGGSGTFGSPDEVFGGGPTVPQAVLPIGATVARAYSPVFGATSANAAAIYAFTLFLTDRTN